MTYGKGQKLTLDLGNGDREYLVLDAAGDVVELLCLYSAGRGPFGSDNKYFGSVVDDFLENSFYDSLSKEAKAAIIPQSITQYEYERDPQAAWCPSHQSYLDYYSKQPLSTKYRHVYLLDIEDIEEYFNHKFDKGDLRALFPGRDDAWLRSATFNGTACYYDAEVSVLLSSQASY